MSIVEETKTYKLRFADNLRSTLKMMMDDNSIDFTRHEMLNSDEAARRVILRMDSEFRTMDTNDFRRKADQLDKMGEAKGGLPTFTGRQPKPIIESLITKLDAWDDAREHDTSDEYKNQIVSQEWRENCAEFKRLKGFQCAACGDVQTGGRLQIHHYHYRTLGNEKPEDVCCVCSPTTKRKCHQLLDLAREIRDQNFPMEELGGLFGGIKDEHDPRSNGWSGGDGLP